MRRRLDAAQEKAGGAPFGEDRLIIATFHSIAIKHLARHVNRQRVLSPAHQNLLLNDAMFSSLRDSDPKDARQMFERYMYAVDRTQLELPSATVVHPLQIVAGLGADALPVTLFATPTEVTEVKNPSVLRRSSS